MKCLFKTSGLLVAVAFLAAGCDPAEDKPSATSDVQAMPAPAAAPAPQATVVSDPPPPEEIMGTSAPRSTTPMMPGGSSTKMGQPAQSNIPELPVSTPTQRTPAPAPAAGSMKKDS